MATLCGWASIDENGKAKGGAAGDQNGKEVKTGNWYDFGQKIVLRFKDRTKAKKAAQTMKTLCTGNYVGYDQNQRTTLYTEMQKVGWDASKLKTKCETDCSAMMSPVLRSAGISVSKDIYTGNMVAAIMGTGQFTKLTASKYTDSGDYLLTGDIMVNEGSHTIMALEDGAKAGGESSGSSSSGSSSSGSSSSGGALSKTVKWKGIITASSLNIRTWAGTENGICSFSPLKKGTEVNVCDSEKASDGSTWYYIEYKGKYGFAHSSYIKQKGSSSAGTSSGAAKVDPAKSKSSGLAGKYKVTASDGLNLRTGAGTSKSKITAMPKGAECQCYGYYTEVNGVKWLLVVYDGKIGFASSEYLKKC